MAKINEIDITSLTFQEGSAPTTPASTKWKIYTKTDGLYYIDDAGTETGPLGSGGGGSSITLIDSSTISTSTASVTFTGIATGYDYLMLVCQLRSDRVNEGDGIVIQMGDGSIDTGSNYAYLATREGSSAGTAQSMGATAITISTSAVGGSGGVSDLGLLVMHIFDYDTAAEFTRMRWDGGLHQSQYTTHVRGSAAYMAANVVDQIKIDQEAGSNWEDGTIQLWGFTSA